MSKNTPDGCYDEKLLENEVSVLTYRQKKVKNGTWAEPSSQISKSANDVTTDSESDSQISASASHTDLITVFEGQMMSVRSASPARLRDTINLS